MNKFSEYTMKFLIFLTSGLFLVMISTSQDYRCILNTGEQFFTDGESYRAIRIDSVNEYPDHSSFYNFFVVGTAGDIWECLTDEHPSWIGARIDAYNNGDHYFFNVYGDSVLIKTGAPLNGEWTCYQSVNGDFVTARVISIQYTEFLGLDDSVKTIRFDAFDGSGNPVSSLVNGKKIKISKSWGIIQALNFRLFPQYYDQVIGEFIGEYALCGMSEPETGVQNLTIEQIFDFETGDEFHIFEESMSWLQEVFYYYEIHRVLAKDWVSDTVIAYTFEQCIRREYLLSDTVITIHDTGTVVVPVYSHEDPGLNELPEMPLTTDNGSEYSWYLQQNGPVEGKMSKYFFGGFYYDPVEDCIIPVIDYDYSRYYLEGLGGPYWHYGSFGSENYRGLVYYKKGDEEWGDPYHCNSLLLAADHPAEGAFHFELAPNPMDDFTKIQISTASGEKWNYRVLSITGKVVREGSLSEPHAILHRQDLEAGLYFITLSHEGGPMQIRKLIVR